MIMPDKWIIEKANAGMISPFAHSSPPGAISYGVSSYGYDARIADDFIMFHRAIPIDPKNTNDHDVTHYKSYNGKFTIPRYGFVLGHTIEYFKLPRNILAICLGKSTYARAGLIVNVTPLEPEWEGQVTIEMSNTTPHDITIYAEEGICQFIFLSASDDNICDISYSDRSGKYMNQRGVVLPRS